jgi:HEAT repeat protein
MLFTGCRHGVVAVLAALMFQAVVAAAEAPESVRLGRAKDYIADEQWARAIAELRLVVADPNEKSRDEALYWLAHSLNQSGDSAAAIATIRRLEREYPTSLWVKPAGSLRLDIAVHLQRSDVLWWLAIPPAPPAPPVPAVAAAPRQPPRAPTPAAPPVPAAPPALAPAPPPAPAAAIPPAPPAPPMPPAMWLPEEYRPDIDLRIQALDRLMPTDAPVVIPILKQIALESGDAREASRALFVLAQSGKAEARKTVVQVAMLAPEPVRIAAVKELGRFGGPDASQELMRVYAASNPPVKIQVVTALGERAERTALLQIAQAEKDPSVKAKAIMTVGLAGGPQVKEQLDLLYKKVGADTKRPIIVGLFNAKAVDELIRIAEEEKDPELRAEALMRLRLLGTPRAKAYLQKADKIR